MDWVISDELTLTIGNIVGWVSAGAMIVGGVIPYIPQYRHIKKTQDAEGFSLYVCLALLVANTLRIFFWFGKRFEYPLLIQSIIMNITMLAMVHLCVQMKNKNKMVQTRSRVFTANPDAAASNNRQSFSQSHSNLQKTWRSSHSICELDRKYFWAWTDFQSYLDCMVIFAILCAIIMYFMIHIRWFVELVGFLAVFTEAMLGLPQLVRNYKSRSTVGMSVTMVIMWTCGDVFKTVYFIIREAPAQFWICGAMQVTVDIAILLQVRWYQHNVEPKRPTVHRVD